MNILFILPNLPWPMTAGGNQAMFNGIKAVKDRASVHVVYFEYYNRYNEAAKKEMEEKLGNVTVTPYIYNHRKGAYKFYYWFIDQLAQIFKIIRNKDFQSDLMPQAYKVRPHEYIDFVNKYIVKNKIDIVQVEMIPDLSLILSLPENVKRIFVHHELRYVFNEQKFQQLGMTSYRYANLKLAKIQEIGLLNLYDSVVTLSSIDKEKLSSAGVKGRIDTSFAVVSTPANVLAFKGDGHLLSFVGPSKQLPNSVGVKWFLENCWEKLLSIDSNYHLRIVGNWREDQKKELQNKYANLEFTGFVKDLSEVVKETIMIVPLTIGSGIRMKILEAASMGIPVVTTTVGVEGIPMVNEKHCLIEDTPDGFINAIIKLKQADTRADIINSANQIIKENYSLEALADNRMAIYSAVLSKHEI